MQLQVNRWGNSPAIRLPAQLARELRVEEGSAIEAEVVSAGQMKLAGGAPEVDVKALVKRLRALHAQMPMTEPVVEQTRRDARC